MSRFRTVFMGSPEFALPALQLIAHDPAFEIVGVYCQPDRPKGRGNLMTPTPVKSSAIRLGLQVWTPLSLKRDPAEVEHLRSLKPDFLVVVAYGLILPKSVLDLPKIGAVNLHGSVLPKYRGAAPVQAAIMAGDEFTGNSVMLMTEQLDAGAVLATDQIPIAHSDTGGSILRILAERGAPLLLKTLKEFAAGQVKPIPQNDAGATYAPKITAESARIDWTEPAGVLVNRIRAMYPNPGAWMWLGDLKCKVGEAIVGSAATANEMPGTVLNSNPEVGLVVACGQGTSIVLRQIQRPGKTMIPVAAFLRGNAVVSGTVLATTGTAV